MNMAPIYANLFLEGLNAVYVPYLVLDDDLLSEASLHQQYAAEEHGNVDAEIDFEYHTVIFRKVLSL